MRRALGATVIVVGVGIAAAFHALGPREAAPPAAPPGKAASRSVPAIEDVVVSAVEDDGSLTRVEIGSVGAVEPRLGFLRSPLLRGFELRDVRVFRDGRLVESIDLLRIGALDGPSALPASLRESRVLEGLTSLAASRL